MKKGISILLVILLFIIYLFSFLPKTFSNENLDVQFYLIFNSHETNIKIGKGRFYNFSYILSSIDGFKYNLRINGNGGLEFKILFNNFNKYFPEKNEIFSSPFLILERIDKKLFMFCVDYNDLYYFETIEKDNSIIIKYNLFIKKKAEIYFYIREINSFEEAIYQYFNLFKEKERRVQDAGLIIPNTTFTKIRNLGITNFNIKYRIVDPKEEYAADRINEASFYGIKNFVILNPININSETIKKNIIKELYFDKNILNKLDGISIITSGIKNLKNEYFYYEKSNKDNSVVQEIFLLNPSPNFQKNKGISSFDIYFNKYIQPLKLSILYNNKQSGLSIDKQGKIDGFALEFSSVIDVFNYNKLHFQNYPTSFYNGKECQFYLVSLYDFLKSVEKKNLIISINPKYYQLTMNSDIVYKDIEILDEINKFPIERAIIKNRPIIYSFNLTYEEIDNNVFEKIFDFALFYGIYPTFSSSTKELSIWNSQEKLKEFLKYIKYYELINEIEKSQFKPITYASITNGKVLRFGDYPEIYFTIDGSGDMVIDKKNLNIEGDFKIVDLLTNEELEYESDENYIKLNLNNGTAIKVFSISKRDEKETSISSINLNKSINFKTILPILLIILSIFIKKIKLKLNPKLLLTLIFVILILIKILINISSPYFMFLSIGIILILTSINEAKIKNLFLFYNSIIFFLISIFYNLITNSQINNIPPFYFYQNLYIFLLILTLLLYLFLHFNWRLLYDLIIFISLFVSFFFENLLSSPIYNPTFDLSFFINLLILLFIFSVLFIRKFKNPFLNILFLLIIILYLFWDKIYYNLLKRNIFLSVDLIPFLILLVLFYVLFYNFIKYEFKTKLKIGYTFLTFFITINSLLLNFFHLNSPDKFSFISSISRLSFYIIFIIFIIFFTESLLTKKEE